MQTILRNNREFQRLGLGQFRAMMNACVPTGAAKPTGAANPTDVVSENSGSLYQPGDEDMQQQAVDKAMLDLDLESPEAGIRGSATSKRVTAIPEARITRKRARELSEPAEVCHVPAADPQGGATDQELTVANAHTQSDNHNMTHQGPCMAKRRMGKGLERISRGKKRPEAPVQAAKLASEAGIIIRDHIPVFPHWKDYMKDDAEAIRNDYTEKIAPAASKRGTNARVQELENELVAEKEGSAAVRAQVDDVVNKLEEERAARKKVEEEHEMLKKQIGEMHGFFRNFLGGNSAPLDAQQ